LKKGQQRGTVLGRCRDHREGITELTDLEKRFVEAYCGRARFSIIRAALAAGYSKRSKGMAGYKVYERQQVRDAIERKLDRESMKDGEILARLTAMARGDLSPFLHVDEDGRTFQLNLASEDAQTALFLVRKLTQTEHLSFSGEEAEETTTRRRTEIELHDSKDALKLLARVRGMLVQKHELTGADGGPIEVDVKAARERLARRLTGIASRISEDGTPSRIRGNGADGS